MTVACSGWTRWLQIGSTVFALLGACEGATLMWDANPEPGIAGYNVYRGQASRAYSMTVDVGNTTNWTMTGLTAGVTYYLAVTAYDGQGLESPFSEELQYTPSSANLAPWISTIANQSITEDTTTASVPFTVGDSQTPATSLVLAAISANQVLVPSANIVLAGSGSNRTVQITPAPNESGAATIVLTVSDGVLSATNAFLLTVNSVNDRPLIGSIAIQTLNEDTATGSINFTIGDAETAAGSLTLSGNSSNPVLLPNSAIAFGGSGSNRTVTLAPASNQAGTIVVTIAVSDGALSASNSFVVTVNQVNDAPQISNIADQTTQAGTGIAPITFTVTDVETIAGDLTLNGTSSNPTLIPAGNIVFGGTDSNRSVSITPAVGQTGTATVTVTVSDGALTASDSFVVTASVSNAATSNFTNSSVITIPDSGPATPYPSAINVTGALGPITGLKLRLNRLTHTWPDDIDILLVSPTGVKMVVMSDAGGKLAATNVDLIISDAAAAVLPDQGQLVSGAFKPTNIGSRDSFPASAPERPYASSLSVFDGLPATGVWKLFVCDDGRGHAGSLQGWSLEVTTDPTQVPKIFTVEIPEPPPSGEMMVRMLARENQCSVLSITGLPSQKYTVEASNDLITWEPIGTVSLNETEELFIDCNDAATHDRRFYRLTENQ